MIAAQVRSRVSARPVPEMATQPAPGARGRAYDQGGSHVEVSSSRDLRSLIHSKPALVKIKTAPIPVSELAMFAIQVKRISIIAPPTHRSLASHIGQDH